MTIEELGYKFNEELMDSKLIFLHVAGSHLYGMNNENSDQDIRGVLLPQKDYWVGAKKVEKPLEFKNENFDVVLYDFRKLALLAFQGNPNVVETLYVEKPEHILQTSYTWSHIQPRLKALMSQQSYQGYYGYSVAQLKKMIVKHGNKTGRKELLEKSGADTKFISHALRLAEQGCELLLTGNITFPRPNAEHLLNVKNGKHYQYGDIEQASKDIEAKLKELDDAKNKSILPKNGDFNQLNQLFMDVYDEFVV